MATNPFNLATPQPVGTPFLANNGNPNTVYNTAATPMQSFGGQPLMHNAAAVGAVLPSPWSNTPVFNPNAAAPLPAVAMPANSAYTNPQAQFWRNLSGAQRPVFNLSTSGAINPNPNWPVPPTTTPPATTPPTTTPPTTRPPTGGGGENNTGGNGGGGGRGGIGGGGGVNVIGTGTPFTNWLNTNTSGGNGRTETAFGFEAYDAPQIGAGDLQNGSVRGWLQDTVGELGSRLGFNSTSDVIGQAIDAVLPGNAYQPGEGWNWGNVLVGVLDRLIPGGGQLAGKIGEMLANSEWGETSDSWVARALRNWVAQNDSAALQSWYNGEGITWNTRQSTENQTNPWLVTTPTYNPTVTVGSPQTVPDGPSGGTGGASGGGSGAGWGGSSAGGGWGIGSGGGVFTGGFLGSLGISGGGSGGGGGVSTSNWGPFTPFFEAE